MEHLEQNGPPMRLIFMGTPQFAVPVLQVLADLPDVTITGVVSPPDRPAGRGRQTVSSPVAQYARERGFPVLQPRSLRPPEIQDELRALEPEVIVVAAYGLLLPPAVLGLPPHGCLNLHPSLLPRHRGPSPVATCILDGDNVTGTTLMLLDEGLDTGPLIAKAERALTGSETTAGLTEALFSLGAVLLAENLKPWVEGRLTATPQDAAQATATRKLERDDGLADWAQPAETLDRRRRAFTPWPGLFTYWDGKGLKLLETEPLASQPAEDNIFGQVVVTGLTDVPVAVATSNGLLGLKRLQLEGRRAVSAKEFIIGFPAFAGSVLG